ncbi:MAG: hypothetical protein SFU25_07875 [Candidatus Caenarcaniphilales bacterium]|nr:hypothetical protein [Candidatus Caenarcaniphilales bacterium]
MLNLASDAEFLYEPVVLSINASGGKGVSVVKFSNPFQNPARIQVSLSEWNVKQGNKYDLLPKDDPNSILKYIKISPAQFTLEPGKTRNVRIATSIPASFDDKEYNLFFQMLEIGADRKILDGPTDAQTLNLNINRQTNAGMYVRKGSGFKCDLQVPSVNATKEHFQDKDVEKTILHYDVTYTNSGNVHTRKDIGIRIFDPSGAVIFEKKYTDTLIAFPTSQTGPITISKKYTLPERLDKDGSYEVEFGFTPSPDDIDGASCQEQSVKTGKVKI